MLSLSEKSSSSSLELLMYGRFIAADLEYGRMSSFYALFRAKSLEVAP